MFANPAFRNAASNPYNALLSQALVARGVKVEELTRRSGFLGKADVVHIHWPQTRATGPLPKALKVSIELVLRLLVQRLRGAAIVWTVHNVHSHLRENPWLERVLMWWVSQLVSGVVYLSPSTRSEAEAAFPNLGGKPWVVIPHGLYGEHYSTPLSQVEARALFGLPTGQSVVGFVGDVRAYKGLDLLIDSFSALEAGEATLFVAGSFAQSENRAELRNGLDNLIAAGHSVVIAERRLSNADMAAALRACDLVALPYHRVTNSGVAILALEQKVRLLTADAPAFRDLQAELGSTWVNISTAGMAAGALKAALGALADEPDWKALDAFERARSWDDIGLRTLQFYERLAAPHPV